MRQVLVPLDFSKDSLNALSYAIRLFHNEPCKFNILHAIENRRKAILEIEHAGKKQASSSGKGLNDSGIDTLMAEILLDARQESTNPKHTFETIALTESLVTAINTVAISKEVDLIIMSASGSRGVKEVFLGHGAIRIIKEVEYWPILVVPQNCIFREPTQIVFSTTLKRAFNGIELAPLIQLAKLFSAKLKILQLMDNRDLNEQQKHHKEMLHSLLAGIKHDFQKLRVHSSETATVHNFSETTDCDMLSLINHRYNFLVNLTQRSVVKKVTFSSPIPILILPELR